MVLQTDGEANEREEFLKMAMAAKKKAAKKAPAKKAAKKAPAKKAKKAAKKK